MPALHHLALLPTTVRQMRSFHEKGVPVKEIARVFSVNRLTVRRRCGNRSGRHKMTEQLEQFICQCYRSGWSKHRFESQGHLDWDVVRRVLLKNGVPIRTRGFPRGKKISPPDQTAGKDGAQNG